MLDDFGSYLWALAGYARWLLAGGPYLIDTLLKRLSPEKAAWLDKRLSPQRRRRAEVGIFLAAIFFAGFLAWRDERVTRLSGERRTANTARHLTDDQKVRMAEQMRLSPDENYVVEFNSVPNCDECEDYAQELREFVGTLPGWKAGGDVITFAGSANRTGLRLFANSKSSPKMVQKIVSAFVSASIPLPEDTPEVYQGLDAIIVVARRQR
jgi:hypothetical protein